MFTHTKYELDNSTIIFYSTNVYAYRHQLNFQRLDFNGKYNYYIGIRLEKTTFNECTEPIACM